MDVPVRDWLEMYSAVSNLDVMGYADIDTTLKRWNK